jgi:hypothetical protein
VGRSAGAALVAGVLRSAVAVLAVGVLLAALFAAFGQPALPAASPEATGPGGPSPGASPTAPDDGREGGTPGASPATSERAASGRSGGGTPEATATRRARHEKERDGTKRDDKKRVDKKRVDKKRDGKKRDGRPQARPTRPVPDVEVVVLNHTETSGLAGRTADDLRGRGWAVAVVGNFVGNVPETTVYYPPGRAPQARLLARRLDVSRVHPAFDGVSETRLTLVLSTDYPRA